MAGGSYEIVETTADAGVEARGASLGEAFENAARGLIELIRGEPPPGEAPGCSSCPVRVEGRGEEAWEPGALLVAFLNECIVELDRRRALPRGVRVEEVGPGGVRATLFWEEPPEAADAVGVEVKAATYHNLRVEKGPGGWEARVIFDL